MRIWIKLKDYLRIFPIFLWCKCVLASKTFLALKTLTSVHFFFFEITNKYAFKDGELQ